MNKTRIIGATAGLALAGAALVASPAGAAAPNPQVTAFWQNLNTLEHSTATCVDLSADQGVVYGGSCLQAFDIALTTPGVTYEYNAVVGVTTGTAATTVPDAPAPVTITYVDCVVVTPGPYGATFDGGPTDPDGTCTTAAALYPDFTVTPTVETVTEPS